MIPRFHKTPGVAFQIGPTRPAYLIRTFLGRIVALAGFGSFVAALLSIAA